jgi:hypothetical protein
MVVDKENVNSARFKSQIYGNLINLLKLQYALKENK